MKRDCKKFTLKIDDFFVRGFEKKNESYIGEERIERQSRENTSGVMKNIWELELKI